MRIILALSPLDVCGSLYRLGHCIVSTTVVVSWLNYLAVINLCDSKTFDYVHLFCVYDVPIK